MRSFSFSSFSLSLSLSLTIVVIIVIVFISPLYALWKIIESFKLCFICNVTVNRIVPNNFVIHELDLCGFILTILNRFSVSLAVICALAVLLVISCGGNIYLWRARRNSKTGESHSGNKAGREATDHENEQGW